MARPHALLAPLSAALLSLLPGAARADPARADVDVATAMRLTGTLDAARLVTSLRAQLGAVSSCLPIIRRTDRVVGSLNVRVAVSQQGVVATRLESPVNPAAAQCLRGAMQRWRVPGVGEGAAMVLIVLPAAQ